MCGWARKTSVCDTEHAVAWRSLRLCILYLSGQHNQPRCSWVIVDKSHWAKHDASLSSVSCATSSRGDGRGKQPTAALVVLDLVGNR